jgi:ligand-binding sensor domain-containing protein
MDTKDWDLWLASPLHGVALIKVGESIGTSQTFWAGAPFPTVASAIRNDGLGHIWVGGTEGLFIYDTATSQLATVTLPTSSQAVAQLAVDSTTSAIWAAVPGALVEIIGIPTGLSWQDASQSFSLKP